MADRAHVELDHRQHYQNIARSRRDTWGRHASPYRSKEKDWGHTVCSPVIHNTYEMIEVQEVMQSLYAVKNNTTIIKLDKEVNVSVIFFEEFKDANSDIWVKNIKTELKKINSGFKAVYVNPSGICFDRMKFDNYEELQNTILLLDQIITYKTTQIVTTRTSYNLYDYTTNSILQVFLEKKGYTYNEETIIKSVAIEDNNFCSVRLKSRRNVSAIDNLSAHAGVS